MRNLAREEVAAMDWPSRIADPDGDRERALQRAYRRAAFWRLVWLFTAALLLCILLLVFTGAL